MASEMTTHNAREPDRKSFLDLPGEIRNRIYGLVYELESRATTKEGTSKYEDMPGILCRSDGCWLVPTLSQKQLYEVEVKVLFDLGLMLASKQIYEEASNVLYGSHSWEISLGSIWEYGARQRRYMCGRQAFLNRFRVLSDGHNDFQERNTVWDHTMDLPDDGLRKMRRCKVVIFLDRNRAPRSWQYPAAEFNTVRDRISSFCDMLNDGPHALQHLDVDLVHSGPQDITYGSLMIDERVLEPFGRLRGLKSARICGNVTESWAKWLQDAMMSDSSVELPSAQPPLEISPRTSTGGKRKISDRQDAREASHRQPKIPRHLLPQPVPPTVVRMKKFLVPYDHWRRTHSDGLH